MKNFVILGSTGSIGTQCLEIIKENRDKFNVSVLTCNKNVDLLFEQIKIFNPKLVSVAKQDDAMQLALKLVRLGLKVNFLGNMEGRTIDLENDLGENDIVVICGAEGLVTAAKCKNSMVLNALVGISGLKPTYEGILAGNDIALANKETLVAGGEIIMSTAKVMGVKILPVDSEHSAIFQCLNGEDSKTVDKITLTASGGPFRGKSLEELNEVTKEEALNHPKWEMGSKITIDSSTLMNKGLEVIEAKWLFNLSMDKIDVVVHPQSIIHSMVEYCDGSVIAQLGNPDMKIPISYAMEYPNRLPMKSDRLNLIKEGQLTFENPDLRTFPCLRMAFEAGEKGGAYPVVLNGANEALVDLFLRGKIKYLDIQNMLEKELSEIEYKNPETIDDILRIDRYTKVKIYTQFGEFKQN